MTSTILLLLLALQGTATTPPQAASHATEYTIGPQDRVDIAVIPDVFSQRGVLIEADGTFQYKEYARITAKGLTVRQLQTRIRELLLEKKQHLNPIVTVEVAAFRAQIVYINGDGVRTPQTYRIQGNDTLMGAIYQAGSFTSKAGPTVIVTRKDASGAASEIRIPRKEVEQGTGLAASFRLQDGDVINVPEAGRVFVQGEVRAPTAYDITDDARLVLDMINAAGGFTERANKNGIKIRRLVNGKPIEIKVPKDLTTPVQHNDTIIVPRRRI